MANTKQKDKIMKKLIVIFLVIITLPAISQTYYPRGLPSPSSNSYSKVGYSRQDSGMIMSARDTFSAAYPTMILWSGDNKYWFTLGSGSRWNPIIPSNALRSIYVGYGLTKINDSTVSADTSLLATRLRVQKGIDSLGVTSSLSYKLKSDTLFNNGFTTRNTTKKIADSLGVVISNYKLANDSLFNTGFTTRAQTKRVVDSLGAIEKNISDTLFNGGYTTRERNKQGNDSIAALLVNYKTLGDSSFNTGFTSRVRTKQQIDSLGSVISVGLATKINISDSATMLTPYLRKYDTTAMLSNYYNKTASDGRFQPLENQRLSTTNSPTFNSITGTGTITLSNTGTSLTQWRAANPIGASGRISVIDVGTNAGLWATYNTSNQRVGYIGDSAGGMKYVAEIGTHNFNARVNVTGDVYALNGNYTNVVTADSLVKSGGTDSQLLAAAGGVVTAGTGITISSGTISASGALTYNASDPNGSAGQSYTPANYPAALLMGGLYGGYLAVTTGSYTVNGNYRFIELKTGASAVGISSTASGQEYYLVNTTGSAISISFTLKDLTGATLTTVPANTSYHIFYNGTEYLKL